MEALPKIRIFFLRVKPFFAEIQFFKILLLTIEKRAVLIIAEKTLFFEEVKTLSNLFTVSLSNGRDPVEWSNHLW